MAIAMADLRAELVVRAEELLAEIGLVLDSEATDRLLDSAITRAFAVFGRWPASGLVMLDLDVAGDSAETLTTILDHAEYVLIWTLLTRYVLVDVKTGENETKWSQLRDGLMARLESLRKALGLERQPMTGGKIIREAASTSSGGLHTPSWVYSP